MFIYLNQKTQQNLCDLFDIEYTTTGENGEYGSFFKVTLKQRLNNYDNN